MPLELSNVLLQNSVYRRKILVRLVDFEIYDGMRMSNTL